MAWPYVRIGGTDGEIGHFKAENDGYRDKLILILVGTMERN